MPSVFFASLEAGDVIEVEFLKLQGGVRTLRLLVDSGFTGRSSFVVRADAQELLCAILPPTETSGALVGKQDRAWVTCRIPGLGYQATLIAIVADISVLALPNGIDGMAGLRFLREFEKWGGERTPTGWQFTLSK